MILVGVAGGPPRVIEIDTPVKIKYFKYRLDSFMDIANALLLQRQR